MLASVLYQIINQSWLKQQHNQSREVRVPGRGMEATKTVVYSLVKFVFFL